MDNLLKIKNLSVSFNVEDKITKAVKNISLDVAKGEALGIVGESGSGKSVTALSVLKLLPYPKAFHPSGEIFYKNKNILKSNEEELQEIRGNSRRSKSSKTHFQSELERQIHKIIKSPAKTDFLVNRSNFFQFWKTIFKKLAIFEVFPFLFSPNAIFGLAVF